MGQYENIWYELKDNRSFDSFSDSGISHFDLSGLSKESITQVFNGVYHRIIFFAKLGYF